MLMPTDHLLDTLLSVVMLMLDVVMLHNFNVGLLPILIFICIYRCRLMLTLTLTLTYRVLTLTLLKL